MTRPSQMKAYHGDRLLALSCSGEVDAERARAATRTACVQASEMGYALIFDLRRAQPRVSPQDTTGLLAESQNLWQWMHRVALVGGDAEVLEWLRFAAGIAVNAGVVAQVFEDWDKARAWVVAAPRDPLEGLNRGGFTVLMVDDDPDVLELSVRGLEGAGFKVLAAASGEECLEVAAREKPDLILLDVVMPGLDGMEVCRRLKADPGMEKSLVALASGVRTGAEDQAGGMAAGADAYIPRPLLARELVARVEILLLKREMDERAGSQGAPSPPGP